MSTLSWPITPDGPTVKASRYHPVPDGQALVACKEAPQPRRQVPRRAQRCDRRTRPRAPAFSYHTGAHLIAPRTLGPLRRTLDHAALSELSVLKGELLPEPPLCVYGVCCDSTQRLPARRARGGGKEGGPESLRRDARSRKTNPRPTLDRLLARNNRGNRFPRGSTPRPCPRSAGRRSRRGADSSWLKSWSTPRRSWISCWTTN